MSRTVAIVEDEPAIRANYRAALEHYGYRVSDYPDRPSAETAFDARLPDLVIIDVGLRDEPEGGFELCRSLRARSPALPIIFLTARDDELDAVSGLRLGADDYLSKDVSLQQLLARVSGLFRRVEALRSGGSTQGERVERGALSLDAEQLRAWWNNAEVPLTVTEFWMVYALARRPGHLKSRDQLMDDAQLVIDPGSVTSHIKRIRKKFIAIDEAFDAIDTVYGAGYRWQVQS